MEEVDAIVAIGEVVVVDELIRAIHPVKDFIAYRKIKNHLLCTQPDIVHTHSAKAGILGRLAAWSAGRPTGCRWVACSGPPGR